MEPLCSRIFYQYYALRMREVAFDGGFAVCRESYIPALITLLSAGYAEFLDSPYTVALQTPGCVFDTFAGLYAPRD
jgi:hypothetical protein